MENLEKFPRIKTRHSYQQTVQNQTNATHALADTAKLANN